MFSRHRDQKLIDHFIYAEGIDIQFFENNHSRYLGQNVPWRFCTHMSNGKEGYLCKVHEPIQPEVIKCMRRDAQEARQRSKDEVTRVHFEKLNDSWRKQEEHQQSRLEGRSRREQECTNMNIPTLQLPPNRARDFYWDEEEQSWIRSNNNAQFTRSTPTSPARPPRDSYWNKLPERGAGRPFSPVSPISSNNDYSDLYQQRPSSSGMIDQHERQHERPRMPRPRSAIFLTQSQQTLQKLPKGSLGAYAWVY